MLPSIIHYWQKGLLFEHLDQLPLAETFLNQVIPIPQEKILSNHIAEMNLSSADILLAPFVFQHAENQSYWIPLWIPLNYQHDQISLRAETVLPWIPGSQFDPLSQNRIFTSSQHDFDDWLRFEYLSEDQQVVCDNWPDLYEILFAKLDKFSDGCWFEHLAKKGYHLSHHAFIIPDHQGSELDRNALQSHFAQIEEIDPKALLASDALAQVYKNDFQLDDASFYAFIHSISLNDGQLQAIHTPIGSAKQALIDAILAYQQRQQQTVLLYQGQSLAKLPWVDLIIIDNAHKLSPAYAFQLLAKAKKALFLGDNQSIRQAPCLGAVQEEFDLRRFNLMDDEILDQMQFKGMLVGTGDAFRVALANSIYQEDQCGFFISTLGLQRQFTDEPNVHFIAVKEATVIEKYNGFCNLQEAQAIARWLAAQQLDMQETLIVTLCYAQKFSIQEMLQSLGVTYQVVTPYELPNKQFSDIIFSSIYTASCQRPFIFDQGEEFLGSILVRVKRRLYIFGDKAVFDLKMHSPSGKLARRFVLPV